VVTGTFHPEPGGPSTYLYNLLGDLVQRGHEVVVITYGDLEDKYDYPYPVIRISRQQPIPVRLIKFVYRILSIGDRYDLLFVSGYGFPAAIANFVLKKPLVMKLVSDFAWEFCTRHGWVTNKVSDFQHEGYSFKVSLLKAIQSFYVKRARIIIVPSNYVKNLVQGWGIPKDRIVVIYNAIQQPDVLGAGKREARAILGFPEDERMLITVGRLILLKRIDQIVRMMPQLGNVKLIVVGDGPERKPLERLVASLNLRDRVLLTGQVSQDKIPLCLRASDLFVLNSETEGLSHVLLEAMAVGIPIIATDAGGNPEVIEDGVNGLLVPIDNQEKLKEAILMVLQDKELAEDFVKRSKEKVAQTFAWDVMVERTLDVFQAAVTK
jgi:glycosyltransferase involved in cell wall biosynthesis